jgi:hypothetical protein
MRSQRRSLLTCVAALSLATAVTTAAQDKSAKDKDSGDKDKRPKLTLTARPPIAMSPARVSLTAELAGGPDDLEDFYCPTVEWDWGDGTSSETTIPTCATWQVAVPATGPTCVDHFHPGS